MNFLSCWFASWIVVSENKIAQAILSGATVSLLLQKNSRRQYGGPNLHRKRERTSLEQFPI